MKKMLWVTFNHSFLIKARLKCYEVLLMFSMRIIPQRQLLVTYLISIMSIS